MLSAFQVSLAYNAGQKLRQLLVDPAGVNTILKILLPSDFNPSFTKPFGTHTFYQGGRTELTPSYIKNGCPNERETLQSIRNTFESLKVLEMLKLFT